MCLLNTWIQPTFHHSLRRYCYLASSIDHKDDEALPAATSDLPNLLYSSYSILCPRAHAWLSFSKPFRRVASILGWPIDMLVRCVRSDWICNYLDRRRRNMEAAANFQSFMDPGAHRSIKQNMQLHHNQPLLSSVGVSAFKHTRLSHACHAWILLISRHICLVSS